MFRPLVRSHRRPHRRGTSFVLIVVVMISFASAVGVAFALFAGQTVRISRANLEGQGGGALPVARAPEPASAANQFFRSLIYGVGDDNPEDLTNALRGHSLAESMYGRSAGNTIPWNGVGTFREDLSTYGLAGVTGNRASVVNYTQMQIGAARVLFDPEWTGHRATNTPGSWPPNFAASTTNRARVGKNAGYSFPDLKDFFAGVIDPATGQVLTQSFHREWLFGSLDPTNGRAATDPPTANNWTNTTGRLLTLRPRPVEHPNFPRVPPNADNTYTGDVQNWPGGYFRDAAGRYIARNDSLWMHIGLPTVQFGNRKLQPLVAPLIVPLDGLFNANAHGNMFGSGGIHVSHAGYGPWEVNIAAALPNNWAAVVAARGAAQQRNGTNQRSYDPYYNGPLPLFSPVAWNGNQVARWTYPAADSLAGVPTYPAAPNDYQSNNQPVVAHPSLFSPAEWGTNSATRTFPLSDIKRLHLRYAFSPDWYELSDLARNAPQDLLRTQPFTFAVVSNTEHRYRIDPAHANRALFTTRSFGLDRPKVAPNFLNRANGAGLQYDPNTNKPAALNAGAFPLPGNTPGAVSDFPAANAWVNQMAALGAVDLNRPLDDYRPVTGRNQPLSTTNITPTTLAAPSQADIDRRRLAHDIFVRLAAATGAALQISLTPVEYPQYQYTVLAAAGTQEYNALRYLAQLAANCVDFRDDDDISTAFVWNPINNNPNDANNFTAAEIGNRVVFGVEKTRLVINEVYSEITNDPTDDVNGAPVAGIPTPLPANSRAHVKFWAELLNPSKPANANAPLSPIPDTIALSAYQIQIARANRITGVAAAEDTVSALAQPNNPTGSFGSDPDASFTLIPPVNGARGTATNVDPNNNTYAPPSAGPAPNFLPNRGILLVAPPEGGAKQGSAEFNTSASPVWSNPGNTYRSNPLSPAPTAGNRNPSRGMGYTLNMGANAGTVVPGNAEFRRHVVLLRRLANPYLQNPVAAAPDPANQFVTVDVMDYVPSWDALHRDVGQGNDRGARGMGARNGYDPVAERFSIGKVQAYAGRSATTNPPANGPGNYNVYAFPNSMVLNQTVANAMGATNAPLNTFSRHNGVPAAAAPANTFTPGNPAAAMNPTEAQLNGTLMTPFDWLVHLDRTLVNQIELFQVRDTPAHRVTDQFLLRSGAAPGVMYDSGFARWTQTNAGISRALEYLTVKPHTAGVAHGGRVPGQINVNAIQDQRILNGLLDPQPGNYFTAAFTNTNAWAAWAATRNARTINATDGVTSATLASGGTANIAVPSGQSIYDGTGGGTNRPFLPFGAPAISDNTGAFAYTGAAYPANEQTILRFDPTTGVPYLYFTGDPVNGPQIPSGATSIPPEPVRKMLNNVTQVNHTYLVFLTVSYFELDGNNVVDLGGGLTMPRLAHEAGVNLPGDMRQKFVAVIDMSNMALNADPTNNTQATVTPFFTTLEQTARATGTPQATLNIGYSVYNNNQLYVGADGRLVEITVGSQLVLGYGVDQQVVTVTNILGAGQVAVTKVANGTDVNFRTAWAGSSLSNVRPGYPGPQPDFKYSSPTYRPVLPLIERLR